MKHARDYYKRWCTFFDTEYRLIKTVTAKQEAEAKALAAYHADREIASDYLAMRVRCEVDTAPALLVRLTCSECGLSKTHGVEGFGDCHFKPTRLDRKCLLCSVHKYGGTATRMKVCGQGIFQCFICSFVKFKKLEATKTVREELIRRTTQYWPGNLTGWSYRKACKGCTDEIVKLCSGPRSGSWNEAVNTIRSTVGRPR